MEGKLHKEEQQWSPVVFFDRPRCILCYRCVRVCGEGMDVWALGTQNRGVQFCHCAEQGGSSGLRRVRYVHRYMPGRSTDFGAYRYKTRPWEMKHVGTVCTHCGDGCKTTLGVRRSKAAWRSSAAIIATRAASMAIFSASRAATPSIFPTSERLRQPLVRRDGKLVPVSWEEAIDYVGERLQQIRDRKGGKRLA